MAEQLQKLGRYELKRVLGRGAMGVVYEGYDPTLGRRVAVKTILKNAAVDPETAAAYSAQFAREAQAAGRLNHPNIVHVHDFAEQGEVAYLVMEYIQGRELRSFFDAKEKFDAAEAVRIMGELLDALHFAHEANIIHRDIKPANIMLDAQRRVKLADFGVARIQDSERSAAGTMVGTPAFMSPEQIQGLKVDRRTDIFSAGVILYQLLTGDQPFTGAGAWTVAKKIMQDDPPRPSTVVQSISPAFDAIVDRALAKDPAHRYPTALEFANALRAALGGGRVVPGVPAKPKGEAKASEAEVEFWRSIQNSTDPSEFEFYLEQFPEGTYAGLARHKIARLSQGDDKARQEAEAKARQEAEAKARQEAEAKARQEAEARARQEAEARARREAEAREKAVREAQEKAAREAQEKAKREADEKARQAQALARLKAQEEAARRAKAAEADADATIAIAPARPRQPAAPRPAAAPPPPPPSPSRVHEPEPRQKSYVIPSIAAVVVVALAVGAFLFFARKPPEPVAQAPASAPAPAAAPKAEVSAADLERIRRETEERIRKEYADKSAAEQAAAMKAAQEKAVQEKQAAMRAAAEKAAAEKAAREKADAEKAVAAARSAAERAAAEKALAEKAAAEKAAAEKAAAERVAAEKAAAEKAAAEKAAAEKAAADKLAAEKAAAEKAAPEKSGPVPPPAHRALLERFRERHGAGKVRNVEPPETMGTGHGALAPGTVIFVNDASCPRGQIKQVTGGNVNRNVPRAYACVSLIDDRETADKPGIPRMVAASGISDDDPALQRFIQKHGARKVVNIEPARVPGALPYNEIIYVNDGQCPPGRIREVTGGNPQRNIFRNSRCIPLE